MQNFRNYYQILEISRDSTVEEIKKSYRRLARQFHPDVNPGNKDAEEKFKDINEAYDILSDAEKRAQYDKFISYWRPKGFAAKMGMKMPDFKNWDARKSRSSNGRRPPQEKDDLDVSEFADFNRFVDQLLGRRKEVRTVSYPPPSAPAATPNSYGPSGTRKRTYAAPPREEIRDIEARLTVPLERAYEGGAERIRLEDGRSIEVNMPAAMISGQKIRLRNQGISGGDLFLKITVAEHPFFKLQRYDIFCELPITPSEAVLGGDVEVPTLDGWVKMKLPPGVVSGKVLRLANKGYPDGRGERGDQLVEIQVMFPQSLTDEERELYEKLRQVEKFKPRRDLPV